MFTLFVYGRFLNRTTRTYWPKDATVFGLSCRVHYNMLALYFGALWLLFGLPAQGNPPAKPLVRSCPDSWTDAALAGKKRAAGKKKNVRKESGGCIELAFSPLYIQEYLQSYARKERWILSGDQLTEDSWTFSLEIDKEALLRDTAAESSPKGIEWTHGSIRVHINTLQLPDGYARTTVHCVIRGYGRSTDQFAVQKEYWELESSNAFESSVISALRDYFSEASPDKAAGKSGSE